MAHVQDWPAGHKTRLVPIVQGEFQVSSDAFIAFSTVLGSCASVCLFDEVAKLSGMNHYLLATGASGSSSNLRYGAHAMELLINQLLNNGASRSRLKAKVFGGSLMTGRFDYIGPSNTSFALNYLAEEGFEVLSQDIGGKGARRVNFHPTTGKARVVQSAPIDEGDILSNAIKPVRQEKADSLTLF